MKKFLLISSLAITASMQLKAQCNELFISEYIEGSGNNKALEIYNASNEPVNLGSYRLIRWSNGALTPPANEIQPLPATVTLAPKAAYVIVVNLTDPNGTGQSAPISLELQEKADTLFSNGCGQEPGNIRAMCFNGDDAISLQKNVSGNWVNVDIFACIGEQPVNSQGTTNPVAGWTSIPPFSSMPAGYDSSVQGPYFRQYWTQNKTLIRKANVGSGVTTNPAPGTFNPSVQWDSLAEDLFDSLGFHNCICSIVGINDVESAEKTQVFPNPSNDFVQVRSALRMESVAIYSVTGQLMMESKPSTPVQELKIETALLPAGTYLVHLKFESGLQTIKKAIVQH